MNTVKLNRQMMTKLECSITTLEEKLSRMSNIVCKNSTNVTLTENEKPTKLFYPQRNTTCKKTKKCQPAAGDWPDLIQTEPVPSRGLARPPKKQIKQKN